MEWIRNLILEAKLPKSQHQVRFDSREAREHLFLITWGLDKQRQRAGGLWVFFGGDSKLHDQFINTDIELRKSIEMLHTYQVISHDYLGSAVQYFQQLLSTAEDVLDQLELAAYTGQGLQNGTKLRTNKFISQLKTGCSVLERLQKTVGKKFGDRKFTASEGISGRNIEFEAWWKTAKDKLPYATRRFDLEDGEPSSGNLDS